MLCKINVLPCFSGTAFVFNDVDLTFYKKFKSVKGVYDSKNSAEKQFLYYFCRIYYTCVN